MAEHTVVMPPMGDAPGELVLTGWLKRPGDHVDKGEPLFEVQTEKVNVSVEALVSGTVARLLVAEGASASEGEPIAVIDDGAA